MLVEGGRPGSPFFVSPVRRLTLLLLPLLLLFRIALEMCLSGRFCPALGRSAATPGLLSLGLQGAVHLVSRPAMRALIYPPFLCPALCPPSIVDLSEILLYNAIGIVGTARAQLRQSIVVAVHSAIFERQSAWSRTRTCSDDCGSLLCHHSLGSGRRIITGGGNR
jgi:hypothetical protein